VYINGSQPLLSRGPFLKSFQWVTTAMQTPHEQLVATVLHVGQ